MKIQYCSDLHLEFEENSRYLSVHPLPVRGEILILAGDIIPLLDEFFHQPFFRFIEENYSRVFWVPGNHEFYYRNMNEFNHSYHIQIRKNISLVNNVTLDISGIRFIFTTLWSKISTGNQKKIEQSVSDFGCIKKGKRDFNAKDFNQLHTHSLHFLHQSLTGPVSRTVVVTHHLPSPLCNSAEHQNSPINEAFCCDLTDFIEKSKVNFWLYGHSHFCQKPLFIGKTLLLTNQLGYVHRKEQLNFRPGAYFAV